MSATLLRTDVVIVGAGIAGLWLHRRLNDMGYHALLLENNAIGGAQTLSSQGIIHGGSKYALNGILSKASQIISSMPARWKACLEGHGEIDLTGVKTLTKHQLLWSKDSLSSKMVSFFASKALSSRMKPVEGVDRPLLFQDPAFHGSLYELDEPVLNVHSLLQELVKPWRQRMVKIPANANFQWQKQGDDITSLHIGDEFEIQAQQYVLTAGEGNEALLHSLAIKKPAMQRRPLQMVLCKSQSSQSLPAIYAHSLGAGAKPIATISSHLDHDNNVVWYIGGNIAEQGVNKDKTTLVAEAEKLLADILPWVELPPLNWATHPINRAEPKQSSLTRPDTAFVSSKGNCHICWPTKLALAPDLTDKVMDCLNNAQLMPDHYYNPDVEQPVIAEPLWHSAFK